MNQREIVSWNVIIRTYARQGKNQDALQQFGQMQQEAVVPNKSTFMSILSLCGSHLPVTEGKQIHARIMSSVFKSDVAVGTALVNMYGRCGSLIDARATFEAMPIRTVVSWTTMISVCARRGQGKEALQFFEKMLGRGVQPDKITFVSILAACSSWVMLIEGRQIHCCIVNCGFEQDIKVANALVNMYGKCGSLEDAQSIFDTMQERDVISWTSLITVLAVHGKSNEALTIFYLMQREGFAPNKVTLISILTMFTTQADLPAAEHIHSHLVEKGFELDVVVANALINTYGKCGSLESARVVFDKMCEQNVISWTAIIAAYVQQGQSEEAFKLFDQMQQGGIVPNKVTLTSILGACSGLAEGKQVHDCILDGGFESDVIVGTALIKMYGNCGSLKNARLTFDNMHERDVVAWTAIIAVYTDNEQCKEAFQLFNQMEGEGIMPDKATFGCLLVACTNQATTVEGEWMHARVVGNGCELDVNIATSLVNMYGKCASPEIARRLFDCMPERTVVSWTAMIGVYVENGQGRKALQLFDQMQQECIFPNKVTFVGVLNACTSQALLTEGRQIHAYILDGGYESEVAIGNALISMYGKCGSLKDARRTFNNMTEQNVVSWSGMIAAYAQHGQGMVALQLFDQMEQKGVLPNNVTFVSILDACASQTSLGEGQRMHVYILHNGFDSDAAVRNAMINMYGKCGSLECAWKIFKNMAERDFVSWNAMIGVYAEHGQGKEALHLFNQMQQEGYVADHVTFVNILVACNHAGLVSNGCHCFTVMIRQHNLSLEHHACMIDLLGRAGLLEVAEVLINQMPFQPTVISFMALLGACRYQVDVERGKCAAKHAFELDPENTAPSFVLSRILTAAGIAEKEEEHAERLSLS